MFEALPLWVLDFFILPLRQDLLTTFWKKLKHPAWVTRPEILQELSRRIHMHHNMERCVEAELEEMFSGQGHIQVALVFRFGIFLCWMFLHGTK